MFYNANIQVGYYEDDDSFYGPFYHTTRIEANSIEEAIFHANKYLKLKMEELNERDPRGTVITIHKDNGELCFEHSLGMLLNISESNIPTEELITIKSHISSELLKHLKIHPEYLYEIRPRQFEELIAEILASYGWDVQITPPTKDGGYDILGITKDISGIRSSWIIECKKYRQDRKVGIDIARALYGSASDLRMPNAAMMIATTSTFTKDVYNFAYSKYNFSLRDYVSILEWIKHYKPNPSGKLYLLENNKLALSENKYINKYS
jgi:hypothetical protein